MWSSIMKLPMSPFSGNFVGASGKQHALILWQTRVLHNDYGSNQSECNQLFEIQVRPATIKFSTDLWNFVFKLKTFNDLISTHLRVYSELEQPTMISTEETSSVQINLIHHKTLYDFSFPPNATISDLSQEISEKIHIPPSNQKFLISKIGLLKPPFRDPEQLLSSISAQKITLMGSTMDEISSMSIASEQAARRVYRSSRPVQKVSAYKTQDFKKEREESKYTFITLEPLSYLPKPYLSLQFLQRLKDDPGIKHVMRKYKFTVPLLTEMDPTEHTQSNHEGSSRTLGLNWNKGQKIELRLRTDAYDGYRDYKTIRRTLCHELTHNVHGPHNRDFWDLCKQIEKEVEQHDWRSGGHVIGGRETYRPAASDDQGWTGGECVLGVNPRDKTVFSSLDIGSSRRELMAKAAEERMKQIKKPQRDGDNNSTKNV